VRGRRQFRLNRLGGRTIAVSESRFITQIAARTVLSEDALSVLVPVFEDIREYAAHPGHFRGARPDGARLGQGAHRHPDLRVRRRRGTRVAPAAC
jgi:hypothetical protein